MNIRLWNSPYNGGWIWFDHKQVLRFSAGWIRDDAKLWWCLLGCCGSITLQSWPFQKYPKNRPSVERK